MNPRFPEARGRVVHITEILRVTFNHVVIDHLLVSIHLLNQLLILRTRTFVIILVRRTDHLRLFDTQCLGPVVLMHVTLVVILLAAFNVHLFALLPKVLNDAVLFTNLQVLVPSQAGHLGVGPESLENQNRLQAEEAVDVVEVAAYVDGCQVNALFPFLARLLCLKNCPVAFISIDAMQLIDAISLVGIMTIHIDKDADLATGHKVQAVLNLAHVQNGVHVMEAILLEKANDLHVQRLLDLQITSKYLRIPDHIDKHACPHILVLKESVVDAVLEVVALVVYLQKPRYLYIPNDHILVGDNTAGAAKVRDGCYLAEVSMITRVQFFYLDEILLLLIMKGRLYYFLV